MGNCLAGEYVEDREKWDFFKAECCNICIVSFPLILKIVLVTF